MKMVTTFVGILAAVHLASAAAPKPHRQAQGKPNVVVFLVDDMGLMDTSAPMLTDDQGKPKAYPLNRWYRTPGMERLAAQGIRFSRFYAHSVCSPTRISIQTGQNSARHRTTAWIRPNANNKGRFGPPDWNWPGLRKDDVTLPGLLRDDGYVTIHVGKAHFGPMEREGEEPLNLGYSVNIGGCAAGQPGSYYGQDGYGHIKGSKLHAVPHLKAYHGSDTYLTEALTLEANKTLTRVVKEEKKPFFLHMAHYAVHAPFHSDPRFMEHYPKTEDKPGKAPAFASMVEGMDKSLGDILDHLEELGVAEDTLVLFLGDNGSDAPLGPDKEHASSAPLRGKKGTHYEGGMRVPFIAAWAKPNPDNPWQQKLPIVAGATQAQIGTIFDLFPTIAALTDIKVPAGHTVDGVDLKTQLAGQQNTKRPEVFLNHFPHGHRSSYFTSLVEGDWKVVYHYPIKEAPRYELFNLVQDPYEKNDLAQSNPKDLRRMMQSMARELEAGKALYPVKDEQELKPVIP